MSKITTAIICTTMILAAPLSASVVNFKFSGKITGSEYGAAAAADVYAVAPIGSAYSFAVSYDPATLATSGGPKYGTYADLAVNAVLTLGGTSFTLPKLNVATGAGPFDGRVRFAMFGNAPFSSTRLAGYQLLDFGFTLFAADAAALPGGALPVSFDLTRFTDRSIRPRFGFGPNGETALRLSIDVPATGVPEPTTWGMLLIGFAATGLALRRALPSPVARIP